ncbi:hypothetical protein F4553_000763 [Allocatelliglobosispora scoriae]|uniref:Uncharacterized protein n=1 Tax=Allocatelliglobosispora scoriae TaxID=643052 RepID=A0A841BGI6_9ACTN|nr:hypothetical protein [Allocatelliglobosispora scoriae]
MSQTPETCWICGSGGANRKSAHHAIRIGPLLTVTPVAGIIAGVPALLDIEHAFACSTDPRLDHPKIRRPHTADRWTWLLFTAYT